MNKKILWEGNVKTDNWEYYCRVTVMTVENYSCIITVQQKLAPETEDWFTVNPESYVWHKAIATALESLPAVT